MPVAVVTPGLRPRLRLGLVLSALPPVAHLALRRQCWVEADASAPSHSDAVGGLDAVPSAGRENYSAEGSGW